MRDARLLLALVAALAVGACARQQQTYYVVDPATGQYPQGQYPQGQYAQGQSAQQGYVQQPQYAQPTYQQPAVQPPPANRNARALYSSSPAYAQQSYAQPTYAQPTYQQPPQTSGGGRGLLTSPNVFTPAYRQQTYVQPAVQPPSVIQYSAPQAGPVMQAAPAAQGGPYVAAPYDYASAPATGQEAYTLDSGDKLRVVVFGQDGITNSYTVDAGGNVTLPLIGSVPARGYSPQQLSKMITERLKQGYVREPHVSVEVEAYRPFFILGEVTTPGQYPYVANMTVETAIAIAGGFAPRASKSKVELTRNAPGQQFRGEVPLSFLLRPGDTVMVKERWF
jgi:protein involved in polysaccharide export with SLBB domain